MDYVKHGEIQGRSLVLFKAHCPCILPCLSPCRKGAESIKKPLQTKGNPIELIIDTEGKKYSTLEICPENFCPSKFLRYVL